ncbi:hypothetical protein DMP75_01375 [Klebsiella michiganensis]|nr:hypothetical protein DMP75_01375 [Klebsiella michiganensis]
MSKEKFERTKPHVNVGTIGHVDHALIHPIAMDDGLRFAIREGGRTVGAGVVAKVLG